MEDMGQYLERKEGEVAVCSLFVTDICSLILDV